VSWMRVSDVKSLGTKHFYPFLHTGVVTVRGNQVHDAAVSGTDINQDSLGLRVFAGERGGYT